MMEWIAKLMEETNKVVQVSTIFADCADENGTVDHDTYGIVNVKEKLAEDLMGIITVCTSWLDALGYNEEKREKLQRRVQRED